MTAALIVIPGLCYALAAALYGLKSQWPLVIVYAGYAFSNVGLWLVDRAAK